MHQNGLVKYKDHFFLKVNNVYPTPPLLELSLFLRVVTRISILRVRYGMVEILEGVRLSVSSFFKKRTNS